MNNAALIYDALRTPRGKGKKDGALYGLKPANLVAGVLRHISQRHALDTSQVEDVILGCTGPVGEQGGNVAKVAVQIAGWSDTVPGMQLDRYCASGLEAINLAANRVIAGSEELIVAGGVESMSRVPMGSAGGPLFNDPEISFALASVPQGISADLMATLDGFSRENVDAFALESHRRAATARGNGWFQRSLVTVTDSNDTPLLSQDECIRNQTTLEGLAKLKPSFQSIGKLGYDDIALRKYNSLERIAHVHTAGNSCALADGASAVVVGNEGIGRRLGLTPRARVIATSTVASEPTIMLAGPGPAARKALKKAGLKVHDIDLFEINEAFASVALRFMQDLDITAEVTNVNGGAIAMGHPLGATGGMLVSIALDELDRRNKKRALIALCAAGGIGIATIIERI